MKSFLFISLPKMRSFLFNPKCLFVVCNIIIVFLVGESKLVGSSSSPPTDIYDEYRKRSQSLRSFSSHEEKKETSKLEMPLIEETTEKVVIHEDKEEVVEEEEEEEEEEERKEKGEEENPEQDENSFVGEEEPGLPDEEFKQRVEDFIERVNRQRRLEAKLSTSCYA
ncbi:hypothetical protein NE237_006284 [Protea cynaroides]|uniref:DUF4408 domain-containing protein n=1 Tax=Protea cynaroides TaxID=273540 RepID=A0A9Q0QVA2_9MAGN|nr:hypothetical protein NE237_006284 [Protea cynaroides]